MNIHQYCIIINDVVEIRNDISPPIFSKIIKSDIVINVYNEMYKTK